MASVSASQSFRYARLGGPVLSSMNRISPFGKALEQRGRTEAAAVIGLSSAVGASPDLDAVAVHPLPAQERILDAFLRMQPDSDLVPKIVNGLIANQRQGRWGNVQENAFILQALKRYFATRE